MKQETINDCYQKSIKLLKTNSCKFGFLASLPQKKAVKRNYLSVFSRDVSIISLGAILSQDKDLIQTAKKSILTLGKNQAENGQIPNYVKPETGRVDFWRLGCIDATLWWLVVIHFYNVHTKDKNLKKILKKKIDKALNWLECQKHVEDNLLMEGEAFDWADIMPRSGKVLYANTLWCLVLKLYNKKDYLKTQKSFHDVFFLFDTKLDQVKKCNLATYNEIKRKGFKKYFLSFVTYLNWGHDLDVYSNSLAIIFGLANKKQEKYVFGEILKKKDKNHLPIPALFNPITKKSKMWRKYMESHNQNYPYQYHNGGIWPYVSCFWALALYKVGKKKEAEKELNLIAKTNLKTDFNEWLHAKTGKPSGMKGQSWNAGAFLLAYNTIIRNDKKLF